ncbi:GNAT family N-acetyltransferase [Ancylobacter sp. 6x-1]|uniref:GNAT family N-acetyltransferase n=1 Tax=Ancylobacter crimeensis TaxID=2579147 RepID=A0ABT0DCJ6_9HYPH|nr:GNAT family N-acetyltransferase [Ancylobacter crimeensis]MCK0197619.1 GNAT family N-acetyltransferase [Ancylobacter crimeensis]
MSSTPENAAASSTDALRFERASRADVPGIVAILATDRVFGERDSDDPAYAHHYEAAYDAIVENGATTLYVARLGERIVGTFELIVVHALLRHGRCLAIAEAVHVAPDMRGRGVGKAMMEFAKAEAKRLGAGSLQLTTHLQRYDAHRFYEAAGFERRHLGFKVELI